MSELPQSWSLVQLGDLLNRIVGGGTPPKAVASYFDGPIPFMTVKDMNAARPSRTIDNISVEALAASSAKLIEKDTIVVATRMGLGKVVRPTVDVAINQDLKALFVNEAIERDFLEWWLRFSAKLIEQKGTGTTVKGITLDTLCSFEVPTPPLPEQRRIVAKMQSITAKSRRARDQLDHIPLLVDKYKQAVLAAAFRGDLTREWDDDSVTNEDHDAARMTLCAELKCRPWKVNKTQPEVRNAPARWRRCYVGQLVAHRSGIAFESKDFSASGTQVVRLGNLYQARLDLTRQPVFLANKEKYAPFSAKAGDILVSQTGTKYKRDYGHFVIVPEDTRLLVNQRVACLTPTKHLNAAFLLFFSQMNEFRDYFFSHETGGVSQGNVGLAGIMDAPLALPSRAEQDEIVCRIKLAYTAIDRLASEATSARRLNDRLYQTVLAKAFRGELVPQNPEDEPASVLLDRIRAERGAAPKAMRGRKAKAA